MERIIVDQDEFIPDTPRQSEHVDPAYMPSFVPDTQPLDEPVDFESMPPSSLEIQSQKDDSLATQ